MRYSPRGTGASEVDRWRRILGTGIGFGEKVFFRMMQLCKGGATTRCPAPSPHPGRRQSGGSEGLRNFTAAAFFARMRRFSTSTPIENAIAK
jgi:hypothetical protein